MRRHVKKTLAGLILGIGSFCWGYTTRVSSEYEAASKCSYPFSCDSETRDPENRTPLPIYQPQVPSAQGFCGPIPSRYSYRATLQPLTCGTADTIRTRERLPHTQEKLDENYELLMNNRREAAQKVLLTDYKWSEQLKFIVRENWSYLEKVGGYNGCQGSIGAEGGGTEPYTTTCYRTGRKETVVQRKVRTRRYCSREKPPPPPPPTPVPMPAPQPSYSGGGTSTPRPPEPPPIFQRELPPPPSGRGERREDIRNNMDRAWDKGSSIIKTYFADGYRTPAQYNRGLRRLPDDRRHTQDPEPTYGCLQWSTTTDEDNDVTFTVDADDLSYTCVRTRYKWCTWFEHRSGTQLCPEPKTATVNVKYETAANWRPGQHPKYDDQLPNQFDLLLGESEVIRVAANTQISSVMKPNIQFANGLKDRKKPWNDYFAVVTPSQLNCEYKNQTIDFKVHTKERNAQAAPNPLQIPVDEKGKEIPFIGVDSKGRPAVLQLVNPGRSFVLDRSNLSRMFGEDEKPTDSSMVTSTKISIERPQQTAGISKKFWADTRFWMRLVWKDGNKTVKVTRPVEFRMDQGLPDGANMNVSLKGEYGIEKFYKLSVPFESLLGILGADPSLDPTREYFLEIKIAQPGFDGIYLSGLEKNEKKRDEDLKVKGKEAYSESKMIPLRAPESKPSIIQRFFHWHSERMGRP